MRLSISSTVTLNDGVSMPLFGLGTWQSADGPETVRAVQYALEIGYRLIDTAAAYGNESSVGVAVRKSNIDRGEIFVTTKVWNSDQGYERTRHACRHSLELLGMDYIDLYLIHWPAADLWQGSWKAMIELREEGLIRSIGVSNFEIHHLTELASISDVVPTVNQVKFNPYTYRKDLLDYSRAHDILLEAYSPLTRGDRLHDPLLKNMAAKYGKTPAQLLIRWPLQLGVAVIPKSSRPERISENADIFDFEISPEDMEILAHLSQ